MNDMRWSASRRAQGRAGRMLRTTVWPTRVTVPKMSLFRSCEVWLGRGAAPISPKLEMGAAPVLLPLAAQAGDDSLQVLGARRVAVHGCRGDEFDA